MKHTLRFFIFTLILTLVSLSTYAFGDSPRQRILMDAGWRFHRGEIDGVTADGADTKPSGKQPATPWRWHDASFSDLRAEVGHRVSAKRENNATTWLKIVAGKNGLVRVRDNFGGRAVKWSAQGVGKAGQDFVAELSMGEALEATLERPDQPPAAPANVAQPVTVVR